jgi:hypothetical protein
VARQHYPDDGDFLEAASIVGIPAAQARAALDEL